MSGEVFWTSTNSRVAEAWQPRQYGLMLAVKSSAFARSSSGVGIARSVSYALSSAGGARKKSPATISAPPLAWVRRSTGSPFSNLTTNSFVGWNGLLTPMCRASALQVTGPELGSSCSAASSAIFARRAWAAAARPFTSPPSQPSGALFSGGGALFRALLRDLRRGEGDDLPTVVGEGDGIHLAGLYALRGVEVNRDFDAETTVVPDRGREREAHEGLVRLGAEHRRLPFHQPPHSCLVLFVHLNLLCPFGRDRPLGGLCSGYEPKRVLCLLLHRWTATHGGRASSSREGCCRV